MIVYSCDEDDRPAGTVCKGVSDAYRHWHSEQPYVIQGPATFEDYANQVREWGVSFLDPCPVCDGPMADHTFRAVSVD